MPYHNERICFRLTAKDSARYRALWGKVFGCRTWTNLVRHALEHFYIHHGSPPPVVSELSDGTLWDFSRRSAPAPEKEPIRQTEPAVSDRLQEFAYANGLGDFTIKTSTPAATRSRTSTPSAGRQKTSTPSAGRQKTSTPSAGRQKNKVKSNKKKAKV